MKQIQKMTITLKCNPTEKMRFDKVKNHLRRKSNSDTLRYLVEEAHEKIFAINNIN